MSEITFRFTFSETKPGSNLKAFVRGILVVDGINVARFDNGRLFWSPKTRSFFFKAPASGPDKGDGKEWPVYRFFPDDKSKADLFNRHVTEAYERWVASKDQEEHAAGAPGRAAPPPPPAAGETLPAGWQKLFDASQQKHYYVKPDGSTTWTAPAAGGVAAPPPPPPAPATAPTPNRNAPKDDAYEGFPTFDTPPGRGRRPTDNI